MSNIEIHGMPQNSAEEMAQGIFNLFASDPFVNDIVVTICPTKVRTKARNPENNVSPFSPFFRLINTKDPNNQIIIDRIRDAFSVFGGIDIEYLELTAFFPKSQRETTYSKVTCK